MNELSCNVGISSNRTVNNGTNVHMGSRLLPRAINLKITNTRKLYTDTVTETESTYKIFNRMY